MPLTSHLKQRNSPISLFFPDQFPNIRTFLADARRQMREASCIRPDKSDRDFPWPTIGTALDYRLRYYFSVTPYDEFAAYMGAQHYQTHFASRILNGEIAKSDDRTISLKSVCRDFFDSLDAVTQRNYPVAKRLSEAEEYELNRYCIVLALLEEVYRSDLRVESPLATGKFDSAESLLSIAESHWLDDLKELSWEFYDSYKCLLALPHVLNPTFDGSGDVGGADADLIVDGTLIDIKATVKQEIKPEWLWQLLGYVLLDYSDRYQINGIGFYMARQGIFFKWSLEEVLAGLCAGEPPTIEELRIRFEKLVQDRLIGRLRRSPQVL